MERQGEPDAAALSRRIRDLFRRDTYSVPLGLELLECGVGHATLAFTPAGPLLNAHGTGHGGVLWTFADMVFGAAGQYDGQILTTETNFAFLRPARAGIRLIGTGRQIARKGRIGHFSVQIVAEGHPEADAVALGRFTGQWTAPRQS